MLHLTYSNRTEALLEALTRDLSAWRAAVSPFDAARLVVPNRNVETWLRHGIARRTGIAANLEVLQLGRFVAGLLGTCAPELKVVDAARLEDLLLTLLLDDGYLARPELKRVRSWLEGAGKGSDAVDLRRVQLARQLARLFEEYGFSRAELLASWPAGPQLGNTPLAQIEEWQRRLWLDARALLARQAGDSGERWLQLAETLDQVPLDRFGDGRPVFFFGASYVARVYQQILGRLATAGELHVYTLNPCAEFWDDLPAGWELRSPARRGARLGAGALDEADPFGFAQEKGNPLLQLWGRPGRENVRLLNELTNCDFHGDFVDPFEEAPTLLRLVQRDLLQNEPEPSAGRAGVEPAALAADRSLRVLACPGVRREAETIAAEIWKLVKEDEQRGGGEPLRFNDVAVLVAGKDPETYFTHLAAVFQEDYGIPFSVSGGSLADESRIAEAVGMLLELPFGRFARGDLLRLVTHPSIAGRFGEVDPDEWIGWCESVGIVHGADHGDHRETYLERDILNWDQGLRRLALGAAMTGARSGDDRALELGGERYLPEELGQSSGAGAAHFGLLARSLIADARFARGARLTTDGWAKLLGALVETYLSPRNDFEQRERDRCARAVRAVADARLGGREVSYRVAYELAVAALGGLSGGQGQYLARGVAIATLQPMRAIPFRAVFVAGLGEGRFPAQDRRDQLDLRQAKPQAGDVSPRERDAYMFLETLLCARDRLYLSYVSRAELTGDPLEPSALVSELLRVVEKSYLPPREKDAPSPLVETHELRRWGPRYFPSLHGGGEDALLAPAARLEAKAAVLRRQIDGLLPAEGGPRDLAALRNALSESGRRLLDEGLGLRPEKIEGGLKLPKTLRLSLPRLRGFLDCPLQSSASVLLGLWQDEEEDLLERDDERFSTPFLEKLGFLRERFGAALAGETRGERVSFDELWDERAGREQLCGRMPAGVFGEVEKAEHLARLGAWRQALAAAAGGRAPGFERVRVGPADEFAQADAVFDPIVLDFAAGELPGLTEPMRVEIFGTLEPQLFGRRASLNLADRGAKSPNTWEQVRLRRLGLRAFVDAVALAAAGGVESERELVAISSNGAETSIGRVSIAAVTAEEARTWLRAIVADLLSGIHSYFMPAEAVIRFHYAEAEGEAKSFEQCADELLQIEKKKPSPSYGSAYGPVRHPENFERPADDRVRELIASRWALYFEKCREISFDEVDQGSGPAGLEAEPAKHGQTRRAAGDSDDEPASQPAKATEPAKRSRGRPKASTAQPELKLPVRATRTRSTKKAED